MSALVLGPLLRCVGSRPDTGGEATIWVETDAPCEVEVRAGQASGRARTFTVASHHYALVLVRGLPDEGVTPYRVLLDGALVWPALPGWPASVIRTGPRAAPTTLAFGSCRVAAPLDDPRNGVDALHALAVRLRAQTTGDWPDTLLLVGDQVYADDYISPQTSAFIRRRRDTRVGAGTQVADVEEYCCLYRESWTPDPVRWLLSTMPTAMVFDDHDVHDDWNTSAAWRREIRQNDWWQARIEAGLMTYWLYQHLGNLDPDELAASELLRTLQAADDGEDVLREYARRADLEADGGGPTRWSFRRTLGTSRLLVLDSRCGRVVNDDRREMLDEPEWAWVREQLSGDYDHLLIATSLPYLLPPGVHHLEAFDEAVADGVWGRRAARLGERLRQGADLEHWAAFGTSFVRMGQLVAEVASGRYGPPPATVTFLSGDVHFGYLAETRQDPQFRDTRVFQAVCSPLRNPLSGVMKLSQQLACSGFATGVGRLLARAARVPQPPFQWEIRGGPAFGNMLATLQLDGRHAVLTVENAVAGPQLRHRFSRRLA